eukprot:sb/3475049/
MLLDLRLPPNTRPLSISLSRLILTTSLSSLTLFCVLLSGLIGEMRLEGQAPSSSQFPFHRGSVLWLGRAVIHRPTESGTFCTIQVQGLNKYLTIPGPGLRVHLGEIFVECPLSSLYGVVGHTKGTSNMQF